MMHPGKMVDPDVALPQIAILGAGIFVRTQYIPRLKEIADRVIVKSIWSRSEESAKAASELARDFAPNIEYKWGDSGIEEIIQDSSITAVAVVLAAQVQIEVSLKMLRAGKHVIQEKPAAGSVSEAEAALSSYNSFCNDLPRQPVWALAENYRFEPAFVESRKLLNSIGDMMHVQVSIEGSMNSKNPYFSSSWRRNFTGGFILDMGVHFIAGLRMIVGCEINMVSAITRHVDVTLPPPDNICSLFQLENGCAGVFVMAVNSSSPKIYWRIDGSKGALQIERDIDNGRHGYMVRFYTAGGHCQSTFYPFSGVNEELKAFISDVLQTNNKEGSSGHNPEARSSYIEGARDVAVLEAMLESSMKQGNPVHVKRL
ncbi:scyllo-inositol 2-dehydrogenase (NADP(+)) IolW-like isoform X1 [Zingiber officinale]|uniref:scyllo-inositol 2-dehydrogenase (NADP(+)) IolW-like isoform X1 n=2 Tax=Zingiber officinale TaxID=94328 RepID=UPI001C4B4CB3|nr:scyllo-inositol 2-dehydrogenase (NADP(+)) IolW-like isoform X1 [Zingiber officinale]